MPYGANIATSKLKEGHIMYEGGLSEATSNNDMMQDG